MVEYLTKEEVMDVLDGLQHEQNISGDASSVGTLLVAKERINKLYTVRPVMTSSWKVIGNKKEVVYCGRCGYKTFAYKRTQYCPECGRKMLNGRPIHDQR